MLRGCWTSTATRVRAPPKQNSWYWPYRPVCCSRRGTRGYELVIRTYVYIPPQAPGPGHACRTTSRRCSSVIFPTTNAPLEGHHHHQFALANGIATPLFTIRFKRVCDV